MKGLLRFTPQIQAAHIGTYRHSRRHRGIMNGIFFVLLHKARRHRSAGSHRQRGHGHRHRGIMKGIFFVLPHKARRHLSAHIGTYRHGHRHMSIMKGIFFVLLHKSMRRRSAGSHWQRGHGHRHRGIGCESMCGSEECKSVSTKSRSHGDSYILVRNPCHTIALACQSERESSGEGGRGPMCHQ